MRASHDLTGDLTRRLLAIAALVTTIAGCVAVDRAAVTTVSKDLAADCTRHCGALDMRLSAVVVVANQGGCVCEPKASPGPEAPRAGAAAAASGGAVAAIQAAAAQQAQQHNSTSSIPSIPSIPSHR